MRGSEITLTDAIIHATKKLKAAGIDNPGFDARILAAHALGFDRAQMLSAAGQPVDAKNLKSLEALIARRAKREPVARILGEREFWSLPFGLNEATLEPRPDSETLVEAVLKKLVLRQQNTAPRILDLGTGTGCLLLSLLHELPEATGLGVDIAPRAVEQAQKNAQKLELDNRARFVTGNWIENIAERFDVIISNPPYIPQKDMEGLMPEVREHDPHLALDGGEDGLTAYRFLIPHMPQYLKPNGLLVFEVGIHQADLVAGLLKKSGFTDITAHHDLGGVERCVSAHIP